jgi:uncharacterized membrane protein (UPF0127 family)
VLAAGLLSGCGDTQEPSPDAAQEAPDEGPADGAGAEVPPLLDVIDGWPETTVTVATDPPLTFDVKVADRDERRRQGLMQVTGLPEEVGMLFLFGERRSGGFWMKDTLVPLDIAYIADGEVVAVLQMAPCEADPCEVYDPGEPYDAALEVNQDVLVDAEVEPGTAVDWEDPREVS